jgi:hypothetical protein
MLPRSRGDMREIMHVEGAITSFGSGGSRDNKSFVSNQSRSTDFSSSVQSPKAGKFAQHYELKVSDSTRALVETLPNTPGTPGRVGMASRPKSPVTGDAEGKPEGDDDIVEVGYDANKSSRFGEWMHGTDRVDDLLIQQGYQILSMIDFPQT